MFILFSFVDLYSLQSVESSSSDVNTNAKVETDGPVADAKSNGHGVAVDEMTSKDYYFDSYAHFGIHEVSPGACDCSLLPAPAVVGY